MGCFNIQDAITKNTLTYSDKCKFMFVSRNPYGGEGPSVYITDNWTPSSTIFIGDYNDYGTMESVQETKGLKIFEEYYNLKIGDILSIVRNNNRSVFSSCSPVINIFKGAEFSKFFFDYDSEVSVENIMKVSNKFALDNGVLRYNYIDGSVYYTFEFIEKQCIIKKFSIYESKKFEVVSIYRVSMFGVSRLSNFFEAISEKTKVLFGFTRQEESRIKKLMELQLFVFSEGVIDYICSKTKIHNNIERELNTVLEKVKEFNDIDDIDSEQRFIMEMKLDSNDFFRSVIPSQHYQFKEIYRTEYLEDLIDEINEFIKLMIFLQNLNISIYPSSYASQETFYKEETSFHKFCSDEARKRSKSSYD